MSETKYAYQKLLAEHKIVESDLPADAKVGITAIKNIEKAINMAEKNGKKISPETIAKIKANDKWVCNEILDFVDKTDENEEDAPYEEEEIIEEIKDETEEEEETGDEPEQKEEQPAVADPKGMKIDAELSVAYEKGKKTITLEELKTISKTAYDVIFDTYDDSGDNGVETSVFSLLETDENVFTLNKKQI